MKTKELSASIEAVLFASGEPISIDRLTQVFDTTPEIIEKSITFLCERLNQSCSSLSVIRLENTYQMTTKKEYSQYIKKAFDIRRKTPLSPAGLEVLAVVAYNQPVTKSFVEQVRGVDCSGVISTLIEKELVEERGRLELPGKPLLYGTTKNFLRCFSIDDLSMLPPLPKSQPDTTDVGEQLELEGNEAAISV